jgi:hypothetical protein
VGYAGVCEVDGCSCCEIYDGEGWAFCWEGYWVWGVAWGEGECKGWVGARGEAQSGCWDECCRWWGAAEGGRVGEVREYGDGRENGMLCKIFSLFLPLLIESLSGLIVVSVAVEVDVCAHLLLRRLLYHPGS